MSLRKRMVVGFLFWGEAVLLVQKTHPAWQANLLNGIGGHIETLEEPLDAMCREFLEETRIDVPREAWGMFCTEYGPEYDLYCFRAQTKSDSERPTAPKRNDAGEILAWVRLALLERTQILHHRRLVGNLHWLLPLAQDWREFELILTTSSDIRQRPTW